MFIVCAGVRARVNGSRTYPLGNKAVGQFPGVYYADAEGSYAAPVLSMHLHCLDGAAKMQGLKQRLFQYILPEIA